MKNKLIILIVIVGLVLTSVFFSSVSAINTAEKIETRCGWFSNPTPGNAWLNDRHGEWLIGVQGGHQAEGDWPSFKDKNWVKTNGHYGYGCACMKLSVDHETSRVSRIFTANARPLSACRKDRYLKEPK